MGTVVPMEQTGKNAAFVLALNLHLALASLYLIATFTELRACEGQRHMMQMFRLRFVRCCRYHSGLTTSVLKSVQRPC